MYYIYFYSVKCTTVSLCEYYDLCALDSLTTLVVLKHEQHNKRKMRILFFLSLSLCVSVYLSVSLSLYLSVSLSLSVLTLYQFLNSQLHFTSVFLFSICSYSSFHFVYLCTCLPSCVYLFNLFLLPPHLCHRANGKCNSLCVSYIMIPISRAHIPVIRYITFSNAI